MKNVDAAARYKFQLTSEKLDDYCHVIEEIVEEVKQNPFSDKNGIKCLTRESIEEMLDQTEMNDIMSTFDVQDELNEKMWQNGMINPRARMRLLDIADKFYSSLEIDWVKPIDIIMTGSLCNYNWSKYSDIDLHIIIDFDEVDERTAFVKDYFDAKKKIWNDEHENLKIYGFPVEVYVQDVNEEHTASGIYSLQRDKWIKEPEIDDFKRVDLDKKTIAHKVNVYVNKIDKLEQETEKETDIAKMDIIAKKVKQLFVLIKHKRREALKNNGSELSTDNITFKALRRIGYIGKLVDLKNKTFDRLNSIK